MRAVRTCTGGGRRGSNDEIAKHVTKLQKKMGRSLGDAKDPLLVSVRSGAKFSMPGMMDTVLNLGLSDRSVKGLAAQTGDERFAYDSYRRFISMYGRIVLDIPAVEFDEPFEKAKAAAGAKSDAEIPARYLAELCDEYKEVVKRATGRAFPQDPMAQLRGAVEAVFRSWNGARAIAYRVRERISHDLGTAVNVQSMVFGNRDDNSGTGVGFTRNAATGENKPYGDFLVNAQGEDVVAGIRNTEDLDALARKFPEIYTELMAIFHRLESHYRDMCDTEFTIEQGKLWMLQTRVGKRTGAAALRMAVDMTKDRHIRLSKNEAVMRITGDHLDQVLHPQLASKNLKVIATGLAASPGAAVGRVYFTADGAADASERGREGHPRAPGDVSRGRARHERERGHPHVAGRAREPRRGRGPRMGHPRRGGRGSDQDRRRDVHGWRRDGARRRHDLPRRRDRSGDPRRSRAAARRSHRPSSTSCSSWADKIRKGKLAVRANADNGPDAANARQFGAEGIGLCRTEHMFLGEDRLPVVRRMILAQTDEEEADALEALRVVQKADFIEILEAMDGLPVTVRLLDPPLHEFLPRVDELEIKEATVGLTPEEQNLLRRGAVVARVQSDARHAWRATRRGEARPLRDAGAGAHGSRRRSGRCGRQAGGRDHDPAHRHP